MAKTIFEVVEGYHYEVMQDGSGRIRTYAKGEFCTDPWGRDLVKAYANKFVYAPPGVSPKFKEGECDDTLAEVSEILRKTNPTVNIVDNEEDAPGPAMKTKPPKSKKKLVVEEDELPEDENLDLEKEAEEDGEEVAVVDDLDAEAGAVEDDFGDDEEEVKPKKKKKKSKTK